VTSEAEKVLPPNGLNPYRAPMGMSVTMCHTRTRCAIEAMSRPAPCSRVWLPSGLKIRAKVARPANGGCGSSLMAASTNQVPRAKKNESPDTWATAWILSFGPKAEALEPESPRQRLPERSMCFTKCIAPLPRKPLGDCRDDRAPITEAWHHHRQYRSYILLQYTLCIG